MVTQVEQRFEFVDNHVAANVFGRNDEHLHAIERHLEVELIARGLEVTARGDQGQVAKAVKALTTLAKMGKGANVLNLRDIFYVLKLVDAGKSDSLNELGEEQIILIGAKGKAIKPKTVGQREYVEAINAYDIVFGIGPAGTGKTYLAVVQAVKYLKNRKVNKIVLTRPAVEAGEKLGFLPGDLQEKVDPYLRPLYDGLYDVLGSEVTQKYIERGVIEVAPLAYMRGRTLEDSFIILDEAQNTTPEQMKMFLTRMGINSKMVITGDVTQVDLPRGHISGLIEVQKVLKDVKGLAFNYLQEIDVVRHPLVQNIISAYAAYGADK